MFSEVVSAVSFLDSQGSFMEVGTLGETVYSCRGACLQVIKSKTFVGRASAHARTQPQQVIKMEICDGNIIESRYVAR